MKNVLRISFVCFALLVLVVLAGLTLSSQAGSVSDSETQYSTSRALMEVEMNVYSYRDADDRVPGETIEEIVANLESFGAKFEEGQVNLLRQGVDGWGKPLILEKQGQSKWVLRSRGANGIDDQGGGDDIEREFNLAPYSQSEAEANPCACGKKEPAAVSAGDPDGPQPTPAVKAEA